MSDIGKVICVIIDMYKTPLNLVEKPKKDINNETKKKKTLEINQGCSNYKTWLKNPPANTKASVFLNLGLKVIAYEKQNDGNRNPASSFSFRN